jgi:hypothetical protein
MNTAIRDIDTLKSVQPNQVIAYLQKNGWHQESFIPDKAEIWVLENQAEDKDSVDILLPLNPAFRDFPLRISEILETLEKIEGRSQVEILETLTYQLSDILSIRLNHQDFANGTIPLSNGVNLLRHAKDLMLSAACSTVEPKKYFERAKPTKANSFLKELQFGQTKRGSFIITIISPIFGIQRDSFDDGEPFERLVVEKLVHALETTKYLAENINLNRSNLPDELIQQGVSSNLCEALVGIHKSGRGRGLEVNFNFSSSIPTNLSSNIIFTPQIMPNIARMGTRLKANIDQNIEIRGEVFRLERQHKDQTGSVTLKDEQSKKIKIELLEPDYRLASQANQERKLVSCRGDLIKEGRTLTLLNPENFSIL